MHFGRASLLVMLGCSLGGCATASDKYPSLAIRDVERAAGTMQPAEPAPYVALRRRQRCSTGSTSSPPRPRTRTRRSWPRHRRRAARSPPRAARDRGTDSWAARRVAVAGLESQRSRAMIALADLDRIYVDAAVEGAELTRIATAATGWPCWSTSRRDDRTMLGICADESRLFRLPGARPRGVLGADDGRARRAGPRRPFAQAQPRRPAVCAGDENAACATLLKGALKVTCVDEQGTERILAIVHPAASSASCSRRSRITTWSR
jgi:hypothetical protein